jgi:magnesium-transporting ATPase (P-type)
MNIRMISGDHIETATATARKAGILQDIDESNNYAVMHADAFESKVGMNEND